MPLTYITSGQANTYCHIQKIKFKINYKRQILKKDRQQKKKSTEEQKKKEKSTRDKSTRDKR